MSQKLKAVGVIPARYGSTRFPGKPFAKILQKPLLQWVIEGAKTSRKLSQIYVATDDELIAKLATECGVPAIMTSSDLSTGTDRVWAAVRQFDAEIIVNIQGDEPLIEGHILDQLLEPFERDPALAMATLGRDLDETALRSAQTAKIVLNELGEAVYFSRLPVPFSRVPTIASVASSIVSNGPLVDLRMSVMKHVGIYAYRREFLERFCNQPPTVIEQLEGLEQLRALYLGARIKVVHVDHDSWGVDTPEDVQKIEQMIRQKRTEPR